MISQTMKLAQHLYDETKQGARTGQLHSWFLSRHWNLLGQDVCKAVIRFHNGGDMPAVVNDTVLVLIPKVKN
jgi:hypothetical protein